MNLIEELSGRCTKCEFVVVPMRKSYEICPRCKGIVTKRGNRRG